LLVFAVLYFHFTY